MAFGATLLFVPLVKSLLGQPRPFALYEGADSFSFPSGHASHAMVVFGIVAVLLAHRLGVRARLAIYFAALCSALMVALSRVNLGAHWPTDVAGGLLFGAAIIAAMGYVLRGRPLAVRPRWMALVLLLAYGGAYGLHRDRAYALWTVNYTHAPEIVQLTSAEWRDGGWKALPQRRITVDGAQTQPFLAQYAGDPLALSRSLASFGWSQEQATAAQSLLSMLLPHGDPSDLPPEIVLHDGQLPVLTLLTLSDATRRRLVLRIWSTSTILVDGSGPPRMIHLVDLSVETF